jgi:phospholipid/cholesterol/gamma-HCH transport system permease protein
MLAASTQAPDVIGPPATRLIGRLGAAVWAQGSEWRHAAAVIGTVLCVSIRPRSWGRPVRTALARQVLAIGVEPVCFVGALAVLVGIAVVVQLSFWVGEAGQSQLLGPLLVAVVARELGPVLINLVVIVRSGSAMTTELGVLKIDGEVRTLEAQGRDPLLQLVLPRVLGTAVSTFCLTVVFILIAFASGYWFAAWLGKGSRDLFLFADTVSRAVQPKDVFSILAKSILPALFAGASCCIGGLGVGESVQDIPLATQRALTRSVAGLFVISAAVSLLTYL